MRHTKLASAAVFTICLACCAMFAVAATAPPNGGNNRIERRARNLPEIAHYITDSMVVVVDDSWAHGEARTQGLTKTHEGWVSPGTYVPAVGVVYDGAIVNSGTEPIVLFVYGSDPNPEQGGNFNGTLTLWPGENIVVGNVASAPYKKVCVCKCGEGWVSVGNNPPCTQFNGQGPCIDPTTSQLQDGFTNCKVGWGSAGTNTAGVATDSSD